MFRVEYFVEDKLLPKTLHVLTGLVRGPPVATPVANVREKGSGAPKAATNGSLITMFEKYIRSRKPGVSLSPDDLRDWLKTHGKQPSSMTYLAKIAIEHRLLRRTGQSSNVRFIPVGTKPVTKKKKKKKLGKKPAKKSTPPATSTNEKG
jgi:hypothetical protein